MLTIMAILSLNTVICRRRDYGSMDNSHVYWRKLRTVHRTGRYYKVSDDTNSVTSPKLEFDTNFVRDIVSSANAKVNTSRSGIL